MSFFFFLFLQLGPRDTTLYRGPERAQCGAEVVVGGRSPSGYATERRGHPALDSGPDGTRPHREAAAAARGLRGCGAMCEY